MRIYIASPYTGDVTNNVRAACKIADMLIERGHTPYIPHLTHLWHLISPKAYKFWIEYSSGFIRHWAEGVFKLYGASPGADSEVKLAQELGIPVYYNIFDIPDCKEDK